MRRCAEYCNTVSIMQKFDLLPVTCTLSHLNGLPMLSYSASKLIIHFMCTSVVKPKEVSQTTYKRLYLNVSLLIEA